VRWDRFARSYADDKVPQPFLELVPKTTAKSVAGSEQESIREKLLATLPGRARRTTLETHLQETLAAVLKADASRLDPTKPMGALGVDSLMALQFVRRLATSTGVALPATAVFNYPTLRLLAAELSRRMGIALDAETAAPESAPAAAETQFAEPSNISELTEEETIRALLGGVKP
jgi:acyl carrier protein